MVTENKVLAELMRRTWKKEPGSGAPLDEVAQTGEVLLRGVIQEEVKRSGDPPSSGPEPEGIGGDPQSPPNSDTKRLIELLCRTGRDLDQNTKLQSLMEKVEGESPKEVLLKVANGIFADGEFKWGRVTALFYFASKQAVKVLRQNIPKVVKTIVSCAMEFLESHLLDWIKARGGWESLLAYFVINAGITIANAAGEALIRALTEAFAGDDFTRRFLTGALSGAVGGALAGGLKGALTGTAIGVLIGAAGGAVIGFLSGVFTTKKKSS